MPDESSQIALVRPSSVESGTNCGTHFRRASLAPGGLESRSYGGENLTDLFAELLEGSGSFLGQVQVDDRCEPRLVIDL